MLESWFLPLLKVKFSGFVFVIWSNWYWRIQLTVIFTGVLFQNVPWYCAHWSRSRSCIFTRLAQLYGYVVFFIFFRYLFILVLNDHFRSFNKSRKIGEAQEKYTETGHHRPRVVSEAWSQSKFTFACLSGILIDIHRIIYKKINNFLMDVE